MKKSLLAYSVVKEFRKEYEEKVSQMIASLQYFLQERGDEQTKVECYQFHSQVKNLSELKLYELAATLSNSKIVNTFDITSCEWSDLEASNDWTFRGSYDMPKDYRSGTLGQCFSFDVSYDAAAMAKTYSEREQEHNRSLISKFFVRKKK